MPAFKSAVAKEWAGLARNVMADLPPVTGDTFALVLGPATKNASGTNNAVCLDRVAMPFDDFVLSIGAVKVSAVLKGADVGDSIDVEVKLIGSGSIFNNPVRLTCVTADGRVEAEVLRADLDTSDISDVGVLALYVDDVTNSHDFEIRDLQATLDCTVAPD